MAQAETFGLPGSLAGLDGWSRCFWLSGALAWQVQLQQLGLLLLLLLLLLRIQYASTATV